MNSKLEFEVSPLGLMRQADVWYVLYRQNITLNTNHKIVAVYCLLVGFEMLLKAYLVFLNKSKYSSVKNLKELKHDFNSILESLRKENNVSLFEKIEKIIDDYNLKTLDINTLRYPTKDDEFLLLAGYLKSHNEYDNIFDEIAAAIAGDLNRRFFSEN